MKKLLLLIIPLCFSLIISTVSRGQILNSEIILTNDTICNGDSIGFSVITDSYYFDFLDGSYDTILLNSSNSIQGCIDTVGEGTVILLQDGIYYENIIWPLTNRIIISSINGPENCIIDGSNLNESVFYLHNGNLNSQSYPSTYLSAGICNVSIRNGYGTIPLFHGSIKTGGGVLIDEYVKAVVSNCLIYNNGIYGTTEYSGGIWVSFGSEAYIYNNTISNNYGVGIWWRSEFQPMDPMFLEPIGYPLGNKGALVNNIITSNSGYGLYLQMGLSKNSYQIRNNNSFGNSGQYPQMSNWYDGVGVSSYTETGFNGNLSQNPLFVDTTILNFSLQSSSPSITAGQFGSMQGYEEQFNIFNDAIFYNWSNGFSTNDFTYFPQNSEEVVLIVSQGSNTNSDTVFIHVDDPVTPVFQPVQGLFAGEVYNLPTTSLNNVQGYWNPSIVDTNITSSYLFSPNPQECANSFSLTVPIIPTTKLNVNVFFDDNQDCQLDNNENVLENVLIKFNNTEYYLESSLDGVILMDSVSDGIYELFIDTSNLNWATNCGFTQTLQILNGLMIDTVNFGIFPNACASPNVSIYAPTLRRCFSNQIVYVSAYNESTATLPIINGHVDVELDQYMQLNSASLPYSNQGNNVFRFLIDTLNPGYILNFTLSTYISCAANNGLTLCMDAEISPVLPCVLDTMPTVPITSVIGSNLIIPEPCVLPWDQSSLQVEGWCQNDSVYFSVTNTGSFGGGDMDCYSPIFIYIDGVLTHIDSLMIVGGATLIYSYPGDGKTWMFYAEQHPLHPGNSHPNAHVEACGDINNWTPDRVNDLPLNDADPVVDIYCGIVTGSYDPNDKKGFPNGLTSNHYIQPNQSLEYYIRFQNTGTDTAFTVIIRDTLDEDLDIFSINSGLSSHDYEFRIYGSRILEWTFNNILLPDSNVNEPESNGFVKFSVNQNLDLTLGTIISNSADIYFDFNSPITTNITQHIINNCMYSASFSIDTISICDNYNWNGANYTQSGSYIFNSQNYLGCDSTAKLELEIKNSTTSIDSHLSCDSFTWIDGNIYTTNNNSSTYTLVNSQGCDSIITLDLNIMNSSNASDTQISCDSLTWLDGNTYFSNNNTATYVLTNAAGCDSIITLDLTINNSSIGTDVQSACNPFTWIDGNTYTSSNNTATYTLPNSQGCDSVVNLDLIIISVDNGITNNSPTLVADASIGATYQWLDCDNNFDEINGETNQIFTAFVNGNYAVEVAQNGCADTSSCENVNNVGISEIPLNINLHPNPTQDQITIDIKGYNGLVTVAVYDLQGRLLETTTNTIVSLKKHAKGIYVLKVSYGEVTEEVRVVRD